MRDPKTPEEWQNAVDAAHGSLALASARDYGFVSGGPEVNIDRCEYIIERGRTHGFTPSGDAVERFTLGLLSTVLSH